MFVGETERRGCGMNMNSLYGPRKSSVVKRRREDSFQTLLSSCTRIFSFFFFNYKLHLITLDILTTKLHLMVFQ